MQGIARLLNSWGNRVSGSDIEISETTDQLKKEGIRVFIGQRKTQIKKDIDYIVKSNAIPDSNPEIVQAKEYQLKILSNSQMIQLMSEKRKLIAVGGAHGKSTVTAMIAFMLIKSGQDPLVFWEQNQISWAGPSGTAGPDQP